MRFSEVAGDVASGGLAVKSAIGREAKKDREIERDSKKGGETCKGCGVGGVWL